jgi:hypothetical protein
MTAHAQRNRRSAENAGIPRVIDAAIDQSRSRLAYTVHVFGDPVERVQIAQPPAVLDIGLDQIPRLSARRWRSSRSASFAATKSRHAPDDLLVEASDQVVIELAVPEQITRLEHCGAHRHVGFGLADAFRDGTRGMADLEPHVPETIKDRLGDRFAPGRLFVWKQEQEIDVRARRQHAATVTAGADDRHALGFRRVLRAIEMLGYELVEHTQDLILHPAQPLGTPAAGAFLDQQPPLRRDLAGGRP